MENDLSACSIFVNPKQFNDPKDFDLYPKTEEADLAQLEAANCDMVLIPSVDDIYPSGFETKLYDFGKLDEFMEGAYRKGHFQGMANVVCRLLQIVEPNRAYFGEKDYQQLRIVQQLFLANPTHGANIMPCIGNDFRHFI
ncbi:unnamed protein product [Cyprideis torosa]|uniref:Pantoate--beta-alanine ligase n=1 Tax=Cyprideis torosa TaxID=163714 RepID=A0A7R8WKQ4_9CRUS|nr:unnamed protein product [Cyprideis torosa]CAG0903455.1 unnamed protein product [Cyprideis torosa]